MGKAERVAWLHGWETERKVANLTGLWDLQNALQPRHKEQFQNRVRGFAAVFIPIGPDHNLNMLNICCHDLA